jgi:SAM-dependent methyltransferase
METVNCALCGSIKATPVWVQRDLLLKRANVTATLVKCDRCGLVYQNPRPTFAEMGEHYPPEYEPYEASPGERGSWLMRRAVQYGIEKRCRPIITRKKGGRLLDVGCASGTFLRGMQKYPGWELGGVEVNAQVAQLASQRYGLNVFAGTLEQAAFPDNYFDVVTLWDVVEHLHNPAASLREIWRILKPDGLLLFRVPNGDSWDAKAFGACWAGLDVPRHLYVFSRGTLSALLEANGFHIVEAGCRAGSYVTFVLSLSFWLTGHGHDGPTARGLIHTLYHPVMRVISVPLFYALDLTGRGALLTVLASK